MHCILYDVLPRPGNSLNNRYGINCVARLTCPNVRLRLCGEKAKKCGETVSPAARGDTRGKNWRFDRLRWRGADTYIIVLFRQIILRYMSPPEKNKGSTGVPAVKENGHRHPPLCVLLYNIFILLFCESCPPCSIYWKADR